MIPQARQAEKNIQQKHTYHLNVGMTKSRVCMEGTYKGVEKGHMEGKAANKKHTSR